MCKGGSVRKTDFKMSYKRVLTVQDISCIGQCSLTVALPILSACGHETVVLPSAVLSSHTGGFKGNTFRDLTEDIPSIADHWHREGIFFDAVYTGYLGNAKQIGYVRRLIQDAAKPGAPVIVDPAMADNGRLYTGFTPAYVEEMKQLCREADYLLPNLTEACLLTGRDYERTDSKGAVCEVAEVLSKQASKATIVLTGIGFEPGETGVLLCREGRLQHYSHKQIAGACHGTGDIFASVFTGVLLRDVPPSEAAAVAAEYVEACISRTVQDEGHWYGAEFEPLLPKLIKRLAAVQNGCVQDR